MTDHEPNPPAPSNTLVEPESVKHQKLRLAIFGLTLAALIVAYQLFKKFSVDPTDLLATNTVGMIAAVETRGDGSQAVIFDANGKKIESPEYKDGINDRDVAWSLDGNRLFFSSDREVVLMTGAGLGAIRGWTDTISTGFPSWRAACAFPDMDRIRRISAPVKS